MEIELLRERARAAECRLPLATRDDEPSNLRDDGTALRSAGVWNVGEVALGALRAAGSFAAPRAG